MGKQKIGGQTGVHLLHFSLSWVLDDGPLVGFVNLRVSHAPGMPGTFSPPPRVNDSDIHHGTCVKHVPWCMPGSLTTSFIWSRWREKRSRHIRRMRNSRFYVSGKRPIVAADTWAQQYWMDGTETKKKSIVVKQTKNTYVIYHFSRPICGIWNSSSWMARTRLILNCQFQGCWWPGDVRTQA